VKKKSPPYALIGAVLFGVVGVYVFFQHEKDQEAAKNAAIAAANAAMEKQLADARSKSVTVAEVQTDVRPVLYARQPVEPGARLSPTFFEKKLTPKDILPDAYTDGADIVGWYATRKIEKGDPLTPRNIGKSLPFMSERISPGMRAVALKIFTGGDVNNTGGFIVDGDKVDLLFTRWSPVGEQYLINTKLVMQNLQILYVPGPPVKTEKTDGVTPIGDIAVTFEVTPEQAQALVYMSHIKNGHFSMILRSRKDDSEVKIKSFEGADYAGDYGKVERMTEKSTERVKQLAAEIEAKEKTQDAQGNTNETTNPTPPSP
jgi:Flp pilus assembly protein CpaB